MIKKIILVVLLLLLNVGFSQEIKSYSWDEKPVFNPIPEIYTNQPAVVLLDKRWVHTRVGYYAFASFVMNHVAVKINKAEEINNYNKIKAESNGYIRNLRDFHARIIKPNGEIKVLSEDKIVEAEIDKVKSIVFEGVEAGDILEYYFIIKENPQAYGVEIFQQQAPVLQAEFITTKDGVDFSIYASKEFFVKKEDGKTITSAKNIPPFVEEKNSKNIKNLVKLIYIIHNQISDNYAWGIFLPQNFKKPKFQFFTKGQARDFLQNLNIQTGTTDEKITKLDHYIKENFDFVWRGEKAKKIKDLNDGKLKLSAGDVFDLYCFSLKNLKIPYQVVVGMSRFIGEVSTERYVAPLSHEFMLYIPETKKFISPYEKHLPYGNPMYELQGATGIVYNPTTNFNAANDITFPTQSADFTVINSVINVKLSDDFSTANIQKTYSNTGYEAQLNRNVFKYLKQEEEKETTKYIKERIFKGLDFEVEKYTLENEAFINNYDNKPFTIKTSGKLKQSIIENAGNLMLVNLGKIIGEQIDLYQETDRKQDVDLAYAKTYKHQIIFTIPEGYEVESTKDLIIQKEMEGDKTQKGIFKSSAKVEGNLLIVDTLEKYENITYTLGMYSEYRKVINAAADFNKTSVVLKPKTKL